MMVVFDGPWTGMQDKELVHSNERLKNTATDPSGQPPPHFKIELSPMHLRCRKLET